jgi:hypothetical protein
MGQFTAPASSSSPSSAAPEVGAFCAVRSPEFARLFTLSMMDWQWGKAAGARSWLITRMCFSFFSPTHAQHNLPTCAHTNAPTPMFRIAPVVVIVVRWISWPSLPSGATLVDGAWPVGRSYDKEAGVKAWDRAFFLESAFFL